MLYFLDWARFGIVDFPSYLLGTIIIVLLPGPNSLYVLTITSQRGWKAGSWASLGIVLGDSVLMLAVAFGAASLLLEMPKLFLTIRWLGAFYLAWIGWGLIQSGLSSLKMQSEAARKAMTSSIANQLMRLHPLFAALGLSLTNPKAIFFFVSFFTQFVDPNFNQPALSFLYLAIVLQIISIAYLLVLMFLGQGLLELFRGHPKWSAVLWFVVGTFFIAVAIRLLII